VGDLSPHFSEHEFMDRRTGHLLGPLAELVQVLERIRAVRGLPLPILSGHRCRASNVTVGGAKRSQHILGAAADIPPGHVTTAEAASCGAVGIGSSDGWAVHVDVRPGPPARWEY
jgi:uncharacterized protein YcbK (DUF882 family)